MAAIAAIASTTVTEPPKQPYSDKWPIESPPWVKQSAGSQFATGKASRLAEMLLQRKYTRIHFAVLSPPVD